MRLKFLHPRPTEGALSIETALCSASLIILFAVFFMITGYCKAYTVIKEYAIKKAMDVSIAGYTLGFNVPGIVIGSEIPDIRNGKIKNLITHCESWGEDTVLNTSYTYVSLLGNIGVKFQSAFTKWEGDNPDADKAVWSLEPFERGRVIESIFGGDLPEFFPVLDAFDELSGHAASIFSIDTTLDRYKKGGYLKKTICKKIKELAEFSYGKCENTIINAIDIESRELIIVIPLNLLSEEQEDAIVSCREYADELNIAINIKQYQNKGFIKHTKSRIR